jgi:transposase
VAESTRLVSHALWEAVEPLLRRTSPTRAAGGRAWMTTPASGRSLFVLMTGIAWRHLPRELGSRRRPRTGG